MIERDYNHPSVVFWSASNEVSTENPEVRGTNVVLIQQAKQLDPTRLAAHISTHWQPHYRRADSFGEGVPEKGHILPKILLRAILSNVNLCAFVFICSIF